MGWKVQRCIHFHHTFQSLGTSFSYRGFSNDFAQWVLSALNCPILLAERLAAQDIRGYLALNDLRTDLLRVTDEYCFSHPKP